MRRQLGHGARTGGLALILALAACARPAPPPVETVEEPAPEVRDRAAVPLAPVELCGDLTRVIDAEEQGFAALRGSPIGPGTWAVDPVLASFADCRLEGGPGRFAARYVCESQPLAQAQGARLDGPFERIAARIRACLASPTWYPREFREGDGLTLADGEKLRTWADMSTSPAPYLQLKSEEDLESRAWRLRLLVHTMR